ncbi:MAG TPA: hypothetical protein VGQ59_01865 [Cyclobacteriaceae bacterium]|jgi:hypothetical protein|nr:hypothetical protein [Cyclobacteriaceae bacterium]
MMKSAKKKHLEVNGWRVGSTTDFLNMTEEPAYIEFELALSKGLQQFKDDKSVFIENKDMLRDGGVFSDCPIGWGPLVRQLFKDIREVCKRHESALPTVVQIKSKFGRLCFYLDHDNLLHKESAVAVAKLIDEAEKKSGTICEITGLTGFRHTKDGWYATLSENKAKELGYTKAP